MHKNILTVVGITILFLGHAIQPSIATVQPESIDVEYFDVTTEFIGLRKKYTTQLTEEEIRELDALFVSIGDSLNKSVSQEETVGIFKDAVLKLDSYGLLGDVGIDETEKLVTSCYKRTILMNTLERLYNRKKGIFSEDENIFCLIFGITSDLMFISPIVIFLWENHPPIADILLEIITMWLILYVPSILIPFCLGRMIYTNWTESNASGMIVSFGLLGRKYWNGTLKGKLVSPIFGIKDIGILGFTGLKIERVTEPKQYFFGYARRVHIEDE